MRTLVAHDALVRALSLDPRNGRLVSVSYDKTIKLWDLKTGTNSYLYLNSQVHMTSSGKLINKFTGKHTSQIFDVKFDVSRIVRYVAALIPFPTTYL